MILAYKIGMSKSKRENVCKAVGNRKLTFKKVSGDIQCIWKWSTIRHHIIMELHNSLWSSIIMGFCPLWHAMNELRLCSANHRPGYWSYLPCDWPSTAWAYSEQETENGPSARFYWACQGLYYPGDTTLSQTNASAPFSLNLHCHWLEVAASVRCTFKFKNILLSLIIHSSYSNRQ